VSSIDYTCSDACSNAATPVTHTTSVRDTTPPTLAITTAGSHEARLARYAKFGNAGHHAGSLGATAADKATARGAGTATYTGHSEAQLHGHALDSHVIQPPPATSRTSPSSRTSSHTGKAVSEVHAAGSTATVRRPRAQVLWCWHAAVIIIQCDSKEHVYKMRGDSKEHTIVHEVLGDSKAPTL
jgi:hypothetical protein